LTDFQTLVRMELADEPPPPRDVIAPALRAGRRGRRQRWAFVAGAVAVIALAAVAVPSLAPWRSWRLSMQAGSPVPVPVSGPPVLATPAGVLEALRYLLPAGQPGRYTGTQDDTMIIVSTELTTDQGTGQVTLNVTHRPGHYAMMRDADTCRGSGRFARDCTRVTMSDGAVLTLMHMEGNCDETIEASSLRPDDTEVTVFVASCLRSSTPAPVVLTDAQAVAIAVNPVFGAHMASSLVDAGAKDFPDLPKAAGQ
jgi:hypothetical protein